MTQFNLINVKNVTDFGAIGDGETDNTDAVEATIKAVVEIGGGTVYFPPGKYICGTIHYRSNLTINISPGASILMTTDEDKIDEGEEFHYDTASDDETSVFRFSLVLAENVDHITLEGGGIIDGNRTRRGGPKPIAIKTCQHVTIKDVTIQNGPNYSISFMNCDYVDVENVTIHKGFADGIDFDNCRYCRVSDCCIEAIDDAICLKTSPALGFISSCEYITITNCILATICNCFKMGTESSGDYLFITVSNCVCKTLPEKISASSGVSLQSVDGAHIMHITISDLTMVNVRCPLLIRLGNRGRAQTVPTPGAIENVIITNIVATGVELPIIISGIPNYPIRHINLSNFIIDYNPPQDVMEINPLEIPENEKKYPDAGMFGKVPIWGVFGRHIEDIILMNLQLRTAPNEKQLGLFVNDAKHTQINELTLIGPENPSGCRDNNNQEPLIWLHDVHFTTIHGYYLTASMIPFIRVTGADTQSVSFLSNSNQSCDAQFDIDEHISPDEITIR